MNNDHHDTPRPPDLDAIIGEGGETPVETVETVEAPSTGFNDFNEFNATPRSERVHPIPEDSTLALARDISRHFSEAPDCFAIAPFMANVGGATTPNCYWSFGGRKYLNVFQFAVGPPGIRKSTAFKIAELTGRAALTSDAFHEGAASDSAAFAKWQKQPHRIQIESEGNTLVTNWRGSYSGREIAARMLKLYDGDGWSQTYKHQEEDGQGAERTIECATLSCAIGATPSVCRFDGVDAKNGLRRRFGYYVADAPAREIDWPRPIDNAALADLIRHLEVIAGLEGEFTLDRTARSLWADIQKRTRAELAELAGGASDEIEIRLAELAETPSRVLKIAENFEVCRYAYGATTDPFTVGAKTLEIAYHHQLACLDASRAVEAVAHRAAIAEEAERIFAVIVAEAVSPRDSVRWTIKDGAVVATRSELTRRFAANGSQRGMNPHRLHNLVMPQVIRLARGTAERTAANGTVYRIPLEEMPHRADEKLPRGARTASGKRTILDYQTADEWTEENLRL